MQLSPPTQYACPCLLLRLVLAGNARVLLGARLDGLVAVVGRAVVLSMVLERIVTLTVDVAPAVPVRLRQLRHSSVHGSHGHVALFLL